MKEMLNNQRPTNYLPIDANNPLTNEPLAKLSTGKFCKPISAPEKPFFKPGRAKIAISDSHPH